jgi:RNA polymerase sigma factor (sigma-70 family)
MTTHPPSGSDSDSGSDFGAPARFPGRGRSGHEPFATTRWTLVLAAGRKSSPDADQALAELCRSYWYPLYAYVRRRGHGREDAEDLVQSFFERFLAKNYFEGLDARRGRFRAFLLAALKHFLANDWDRVRRQKRGGGVASLSLDWQDADERYRVDSPDPRSPDLAFDRTWALTLLERVMTRLEQESRGPDQEELFRVAKGFLMLGSEAIPYAEAARQLGREEGAVRVAVHRLRKRYRELLRAEIGQTLSDPAQADEELRSLQAALA